MDKLRINHENPETVRKKHEVYCHRLELIIDGKEIGYANLFYHNSPFPFYYVAWLEVKKEYRKKGCVSFFMKEINKFLDSKGKVGLLQINTISQSYLGKFYKIFGWREVPNITGWYVYNQPNTILIHHLEKAIHTINKL